MKSDSPDLGQLVILDLNYINLEPSKEQVFGGDAFAYTHSWGTGTSTDGAALAWATGPITHTDTSVFSSVINYGPISTGYGTANAYASSRNGFHSSNAWSDSTSLSFASFSSFQW